MAVLTTALVLTSAPAAADAIDGDWCSQSGEHLTIRGPSLITPGGARIAGDYSRHSFTYTVPLPEKHAGSKVYMSQLNEETMILRRLPKDTKQFGPAETWHRCGVTS